MKSASPYANIERYDPLLIERLKDCIDSEGGIYMAAFRLYVHPGTLEKIMNNMQVSLPTRRKIETSLGLQSPPKLSVLDSFDKQRVINDLESFVKKCKSKIDAALHLGVRPSTLKKIFDGKPVSSLTMQKIDQLLKNGALSKNLPDYPAVEERLTRGKVDKQVCRKGHDYPAVKKERLIRVYNLYKELGTLDAVGKKMGVTRERVRQILVKGTRLGLFEYKPFDYPYISKEKIISDYVHFMNFDKVASINNISSSYLKKLMTAYSITEQHLVAYRQEGRRPHCIQQYNRLVDKLGHHPTTTELQSFPEGHALHSRIIRLWGTIDTFRERLNIPKPPQGSHSFREDTKQWREHKQRVALISRMQHLDGIRERLDTSGPMAASQISCECNLGMGRTGNLLRLLVATKEVAREGYGAYVKYRLVKGQGER